MSDGGEAQLTFRDAFRDDSDKEDFESDSSDGGDDNAAAKATAAPQSDDPVQRALESGQWQKVKDPNSGKFYFYNTLTRKTTWDLARELGVAPVRRDPPPIVADEGSASPGQLPALELDASFGGGSVAVDSGRGGDSARAAMPGADDSLTDHPVAFAVQPVRQRSTAESDEVEDDETAKINILRRGGRIPVETAYRSSSAFGQGNEDLFNSVAGFKAFETESETSQSKPSQSAADEFRRASGSMQATASQPVGESAQASAPKAAATKASEPAEAAAEVPKPTVVPAKRPAFLDSDSSDFSTASQTVAKMKAEQQEKAKVADNTAPTATAGAPSAKRPSVTLGPEGAPTAAAAVATTAPPTPGAASIPPRKVDVKPAADVTASTLPVPSRAVLSEPSAASLPHQTVPYPQHVGSAPVPPQQTELQQQTAALESLVRAYAQLRHAQPANQASSSGRTVDDRIAAAVRAALDDHDDDPDMDAMRAPATSASSSRGRVTHLLHRSHQAMRQYEASRLQRRSAASAISENHLDETILDVVLGLYMQDGVRGRPETVRAPRPKFNDPEALLERPIEQQRLSQPPRVSTVADAADLHDSVTTALDKFVVAFVVKACRTWRTSEANACAAAVRAVLLDVNSALAVMVNAAEGNPVPIPQGAAFVSRRRLAAGDDALDRIIDRIVQCLPIDELSAQADTAGANRKYAFEFWVTARHLREVQRATVDTVRKLEVLAADNYNTFGGGAATDSVPEFAVPEVPVFETRIVDRSAFERKFEAPGSQTESTERFTQSLIQDDEAANDVLLSVAKLCDSVSAEVARPDVDAHVSDAARLKLSRNRRLAAESAVAETVQELLNDEDIRAAVLRQATAKAKAALARDPANQVLESAQQRVNRMVERLKHELGFDDAR